ncbi:hypothetical protein BU23DRAFT_573531 [Bimuria novae-zelandiae CBS 107.79]|uniref:Uncharacterized protein n=1 Tax=Bimuria novae-zelandiae CBS 107.79 TaxID=1447943 RepID=A0A6A5UQR0_9PLEO|nr:hypothetical protein BU23DRAFT_573531 [Bimuria novae-zelandiae CBS 107.79]
MRSVFLGTTFLFTLVSSSSSQFLPLGLFHREPAGCQYPSLSDGTYIYFDRPGEPFHYSIFTPWSRFYPDAVRSDLAEQGFRLGVQHGANENDMCGWELVDEVKRSGWLRGKVSFRHLPRGGVKIASASDTKPPNKTSVSHSLHTDGAAPAKPAKADTKPAASTVEHLVNHTRREHPHARPNYTFAAPSYLDNMMPLMEPMGGPITYSSPPEDHQKPMSRRQGPKPQNETLTIIHNILLSNSPSADIIFLMLEIILPIAGVIGFLTLVIFAVRHVTHKLYPNHEVDSEHDDIELSPVGMSLSVQSDKTLVNPLPNLLKKPAKAGRGQHQREVEPYLHAQNGELLAWRMAMERPVAQLQGTMDVSAPPYAKNDYGGFTLVQPAMGTQPPPSPPRQSSSVYSRSVDGVTLYPQMNAGSWESH